MFMLYLSISNSYQVLILITQIFKDGTLFFSRGTPNLAKVIPAMDHIDQHLATAALNRKYLPSVQAAVTLGKNLLNKYYTLTDSSDLYRIAMSTSSPDSDVDK